MGQEVTREDIIREFSLVNQMTEDGIILSGTGPEKSCKCPFHNDTRPSCRVNIVKETWYCNVCDIGGSIVDYLAKKKGRDPGDIFTELIKELQQAEFFNPAWPTYPDPGDAQVPVATYVYQDKFGNDVYRVLRYFPKTFKQQKKTTDGWAWGMDGVERVLYRLPEILSSPDTAIWITEGEKDVEGLEKLGLLATTNVGGAGKWLDGYTDSLVGRNVIICGDNDEPGRKHVERLVEALDGKCNSIKRVVVPAPFKDVSDYLTTFGSKEAAGDALNVLVEKAVVMVAGGTVPIYSMSEMEDRYIEFINKKEQRSYSFSKWLPSIGSKVRPLVPGDLVCFVAMTGVGKSALLFNMALKAGVPSVLFEMELADTLTFERFVSAAMNIGQEDVEAAYKANTAPDWREKKELLDIYTCTMSGLTVEQIEKIVNKAELKIGKRPVLILIDYAQLLRSSGKTRYEKMTEAASDLKSMAKNTGTIVAVASQTMRKFNGNPEIGLFDAKDSGQIENSAGLMIGAWRDKNDDAVINLRINKNTKGRSGAIIQCNFDGNKMLITERSQVVE